MRKSLLPLFLLLFLPVSCLAGPSTAPPGPLIVILLPATSLRAWQAADAPHLHFLMATGAMAVMNTRTARLPNDRTRETPESTALTLGAGSRAAGGPDAAAFVPASLSVAGTVATAGQIFERRLGHAAPVNMAVNIGWPAVLSANTRHGYDIHPGNLADTLRADSIAVRAGGGPIADLVASSGDGEVVAANSLVVSPSEFLIWDAGSDLTAADNVLGQAAVYVKAQHGRLIVLSPFADDSDYKVGRRLTPVLEWGADIPAGMLTSASTHRMGLVTNTDFAPTVAAYYGQTTMAVRAFGVCWLAHPAPDAVKTVSALEQQSYRQMHGLSILPYLAVALAIWLSLGTCLARFAKMPALWPLAPPALLLALLVSDTAVMAAGLFLLLLLTVWALRRCSGGRALLIILLSATTLILIADMMTRSRLMPRSLLGYSAVEGARYYGIGNEAMGVLIGSLLVITARGWRRAWSVQTFLALLLALTSLLLGAPQAGAKAGGLLVSLAAFATLMYGLRGGRWSLRVIFTLLLGALLVMLFAAVGDALLPATRQSHIGEAVLRIRAGGLAEAQDIALRKLLVEIRLAYHSAWACLLWGGLLSTLALWKARLGGDIMEKSALRTAGMVALAACFTLNDAGVVAAALCLIPLWSDAALDCLSEKPPAKIDSLGAVAHVK